LHNCDVEQTAVAEESINALLLAYILSIHLNRLSSSASSPSCLRSSPGRSTTRSRVREPQTPSGRRGSNGVPGSLALQRGKAQRTSEGGGANRWSSAASSHLILVALTSVSCLSPPHWLRTSVRCRDDETGGRKWLAVPFRD
jgi:hypothetical protein